MTVTGERAAAPRRHEVESPYAWVRLVASVALSTIGGVGMWSVVVVLPAVQAEFGTARAGASLPYTLAMIGFVFGGIITGRLADKFGIVLPVVSGTICLAVGYVVASFAASLWQFALVHGVLIGLLGSSATFGPIVADISHWFTRRRGIAVAVAASGSYLAGTIWPPIVQHFAATVGWRHTYLGIAAFCLVTMLPLVLVLRPRAPGHGVGQTAAAARPQRAIPGLSPALLQLLLIVAGIACCVAMAMPQVHIVAYCADLGYGTAHGAQMLSAMLGFGIVSRLASGWVMDRIGGLPTLLVGSTLQALSLLLYIPFDGLASLYVVSALFGLFQGGIVPSYAMIVRDYFPPGQAATRVGLVFSATLAGMALGGWMSGAIFDATGSYQAAFLNGIAWNLVNIAIAVWLLRKSMRARRAALDLPPGGMTI
jgi:MFS family permease